jgi:hypothetical protein
MNIVKVRLKKGLRASDSKKGWFKLVAQVMLGKRNGYAFHGDFVRCGTCPLYAGSLLVEYRPFDDEVTFSPRDVGYLWRVGDDGKLQHLATLDGWYGDDAAFAEFAARAHRELAGTPEESRNLAPDNRPAWNGGRASPPDSGSRASSPGHPPAAAPRPAPQAAQPCSTGVPPVSPPAPTIDHARAILTAPDATLIAEMLRRGYSVQRAMPCPPTDR